MGAHVRVSSKWSMKKFIDYLRGIEEPPDFRTIGKLEAAFSTVFEATQAKTHILTGSLKASGKTSTDFNGRIWQGEIVYGGELLGAPTPGPAHDPVVYAVYEAARGPEHDPLAGLERYEALFEEAVDEHFKRRR